MHKYQKYFYLSVIFVLLSVFLSVYNPIINSLFGSITAIILFTGLINAMLLILSVIFIDRAIKHPEGTTERVARAARWWPYVILIVIIYHFISGILLFGIL